MKLLHILVLAVCLCAVSGFLPYKIVKKYAIKKMAQSCFGKELMENLRDEMLAARAKCSGHEVSYFDDDEDESPVADVLDSMDETQSTRRRRSSHHILTPQKLQKMKLKLDFMMGNITCVMREMKFLDANNALDLTSMKERLDQMDLPAPMIQDLKEGVDQCSSFSTCLPEASFEQSPPVIRDFSRQYLFFKCFKMVKIEACMKQDFRTEYLPLLQSHSDEPLDETKTFETILAAKALSGYMQNEI